MQRATNSFDSFASNTKPFTIDMVYFYKTFKVWVIKKIYFLNIYCRREKFRVRFLKIESTTFNQQRCIKLTKSDRKDIYSPKK